MRAQRITLMTRKTLFAAALLAPAIASADPAAAPAAAPDLRLHEAPAVHLRMRVRLQDKAPVTTAQAPAPAATPNADGADVTVKPGDDSGAISSKYHPIPTTARDLQERVIFKVNAGYQLDSAPASGETLRGGQPLVDGFANERRWVLGDAVLGTRDVLLPSLNGYFLASYQFDTSDAIATRTATISPTDATGQNVAIKAGYAEYGTEDKDNNHFWLRAGRQTRSDGGAMFAYFDGATVGYRNDDLAVSAFAGERVALYIDTPTGTTFGGTFGFDLKKWKNIPLKVAVDYEGLQVSTGLGTGKTDQPTIDESVQSLTSNDSELRQLISVTGNLDLGKRAHLDLRLRVVDGGANPGIPLGTGETGVDPSSGGFQFGRASAHLRVTTSKDTMLVLDVQQRGAGDLAYDLAAPTNVDVVDVARQTGLGVGLSQPVNATMIGAQLDYRRTSTELMVFGKLNATEGTVVTADQEGYVEGGAAVAGSPIVNTWFTGMYKYRAYFLNSIDITPGALDAFGDTSSAGLNSLHEVSLDGWWRNTSKDHRVRLGAGVFYRVYNLVTPYVQTDNDGRGGGRADAQVFLTQQLHLQLAGEVAQADPTLMREIGTMASVRVALEARW